MAFNYDVNYVRDQFPALSLRVNGKQAAFLDGPGGSQVPERVGEKILDYLYYHNANEHGVFKSSMDTMTLVDEAREALADFLGCSPREVAFGASTTADNFMLSHALRRDLHPGDEVIITDIDHISNRSPWMHLSEIGVIVKSVKVDSETCQLDFEDYKTKLSPKTRLVALNYASNAVGTVTDVRKFIDLAHEVGAITTVDAVHYAAHHPIDVKSIDTDILVCSAYKFFGPHIGVVYIREELFEKLKTIKVDADDILVPPIKFQTGTPNFEHICGAGEAINFIADIGEKFGSDFDAATAQLSGRRRQVVKGMLAIDTYEETLAFRLRSELRRIPGVRVYGPAEGEKRTTTVSFTVAGKNSNEVALALANEGIYTWDGDFYAITLVNEVLGLGKQGGLVRIGFAPYNLMDDVDRVLKVITSL